MIFFTAVVEMNHYNVIRQAVVKAYPQRSNEYHTSEAKKIYDVVKQEKDDGAKLNAVESELKKLRELTTKSKTQSLMYFLKVLTNIVLL